MPGREVSWLPEAALTRMQADLIAHQDITRAQLAERVIEDAAPIAAYSVVDLAASSEDEAVRLRAAQYILDRANGKPKTTLTVTSNPHDPVLKLIEGVVVERGVVTDPDPVGPADTDLYPTGPEPSRYPYAATVIDGASGLPIRGEAASGPFAPPVTKATDDDQEPTTR